MGPWGYFWVGFAAGAAVVGLGVVALGVWVAVSGNDHDTEEPQD